MNIKNQADDHAELNIADSNGRDITISLRQGSQVMPGLDKYHPPFSLKVNMGISSGEGVAHSDALTVTIGVDGSLGID